MWASCENRTLADRHLLSYTVGGAHPTKIEYVHIYIYIIPIYNNTSSMQNHNLIHRSKMPAYPYHPKMALWIRIPYLYINIIRLRGHVVLRKAVLFFSTIYIYIHMYIFVPGKCFWHAFCVVLGPLAENIYMHQWTHLKTNAEKHFKLWAKFGHGRVF